jgi:hypothetical protein
MKFISQFSELNSNLYKFFNFAKVWTYSENRQKQRPHGPIPGSDPARTQQRPGHSTHSQNLGAAHGVGGTRMTSVSRRCALARRRRSAGPPAELDDGQKGAPTQWHFSAGGSNEPHRHGVEGRRQLRRGLDRASSHRRWGRWGCYNLRVRKEWAKAVGYGDDDAGKELGSGRDAYKSRKAATRARRWAAPAGAPAWWWAATQSGGRRQAGTGRGLGGGVVRATRFGPGVMALFRQRSGASDSAPFSARTVKGGNCRRLPARSQHVVIEPMIGGSHTSTRIRFCLNQEIHFPCEKRR